ncbi:hypothetical protein CH063_05966, partial [Colletotrichum higginsianum]
HKELESQDRSRKHICLFAASLLLAKPSQGRDRDTSAGKEKKRKAKGQCKNQNQRGDWASFRSLSLATRARPLNPGISCPSCCICISAEALVRCSSQSCVQTADVL